MKSYLNKIHFSLVAKLRVSRSVPIQTGYLKAPAELASKIRFSGGFFFWQTVFKCIFSNWNEIKMASIVVSVIGPP